MAINRRTVLTSAVAGAAALRAPRIVRAQAQRPGRGLWVEMDDPHAVLAAWTDPPAQDSLSAGH